MMNITSNSPAATLNIRDHALPSSAAEASADLPPAEAEAPIDLPLIEAEQDALNGGCGGACGGIRFNHNQTLAESVDAGRGS